MSSDPEMRRHGEALFTGMHRLATSDVTVAISARNHNPGRRLLDYAAPRAFPVNASGPCERVDRYCPKAEGYAVLVDPGWSKFKNVSIEVRFVHELGHVLSFMDGKSGPEDSAQNDQDAVNYEDHYRAISGCGTRRNHHWSGGECQ
jgi:hypothetical protein